MSTTTMATMNRMAATTTAATTATLQSTAGNDLEGRIQEKGTSWGLGVWNDRGGSSFFFEGDEDDVGCIYDGHDGTDCGNDDGRDETTSRMNILTMQAPKTTTMMATATTTMAIIGWYEDKSTINNNGTMML